MILKTGRITAKSLEVYAKSGYVPILVVRYLNPLVEVYRNTPIHVPELSPSADLLKDYKFDDNITYKDFTDRFKLELAKVDLATTLNKIDDLITKTNSRGAVLLCYCRDYTACHRSILANLLNQSGILSERVTELYV